MSIHDALARQFDATFRAVRLACEQIPAEHWAAGDIDYLIPARHILHVLDTMVIGYFSDGPPAWEAPHPYFSRKLDWEDTPADELPDQTRMLGYLDFAQQHMSRWLDRHRDEQLLEPKDFCPWTGPNLLSHCIYNIRHNQGHLQEINAELRRRGLKRIPWQT